MIRINEVKEMATILVVEDDKHTQLLTEARLKKHFKVLSCNNGKEALDLVYKTTIDLIVSDVMMPEMDGYESTTEIRKISAFKHLPILAVTAKAMMGDREKCIAAGASDYISKPVDVDQLISLLRVWLYDKN